MKKALLIFLCITMIFSFSASASFTIEDAYSEFNAKHPEFVESMVNYGVPEELLISYLYDVYDYMLEINTTTPVTEENFEEKALLAISRVASREQYYPIQDALLIVYPEAIKLAISEGKVSDDIRPLVDTVKAIIFNNGMLDQLPAEEIPETESLFTDMKTSHWAYDSVKRLAENFILNGYLDGTFKPDANITRGEFAKIIVSATDTLDVDATSSFSDVSTSDWYYLYVSSALKEGYITGYPDGTFRPDAYITRADICTIVQRCLEAEFQTGVTAFSDDHLIPIYARDAVYSLVSLGIINGMGDRTFAPKAFATRAQTAKIIDKAFFQ